MSNHGRNGSFDALEIKKRPVMRVTGRFVNAHLYFLRYENDSWFFSLR